MSTDEMQTTIAYTPAALVEAAQRVQEERRCSLAQAPGSASRRVGPDWIDYLKDTGNYERYDGTCDCYVCRQIQKDYWPWKERKQNGKLCREQGGKDADGR